MHIGNEIRVRLRKDGRSVAWFADQICVTRTHAYKIFDRPDMDTDLLFRISRALNHDFFSDLSDEIQGKLIKNSVQ